MLISFVALLGSATALSSTTVRVSVGEGLRATLSESRSLFLEAQPLRGEGLYSLALRLCQSADAAREISRENDGVKDLQSGRRYRVPFALLRPELKTKVVKALFRDDRAEALGWRHVVGPRGTASGESLWQVALWFTGQGENFAVLREITSRSAICSCDSPRATRRSTSTSRAVRPAGHSRRRLTR